MSTVTTRPGVNFRDYTTWAGALLALGQVLGAIPHPTVQAAGPVLTALSGAVMTFFTFSQKPAT